MLLSKSPDRGMLFIKDMITIEESSVNILWTSFQKQWRLKLYLFRRRLETNSYCISINKIYSEITHDSVPQGSILGPSLYCTGTANT